jgi:glucosamine-6-phosphate deaminase
MARDASIDWKKTTMFHLDEYVGVSDQHPASFRRYLRERLVDKTHPKEVFFIEGDAPDPEAEAIRLGEIISRYAIDVAFIGVGENAHVAFNDPPADFEVKSPYIVVNLDEACRRQQVGEGWFASVDDVPSRAITMSVSQIMKAKTIVCVVPDSRKAQAIENSFGTTDVNPMYPASILKRHPQAFVFLDKESGSLFDQKVRQ